MYTFEIVIGKEAEGEGYQSKTDRQRERERETGRQVGRQAAGRQKNTQTDRNSH